MSDAGTSGRLINSTAAFDLRFSYLKRSLVLADYMPVHSIDSW